MLGKSIEPVLIKKFNTVEVSIADKELFTQTRHYNFYGVSVTVVNRHWMTVSQLIPTVLFSQRPIIQSSTM